MEINMMKNINVFLLGTAFMLIFTAFQTTGNIEALILKSAQNNSSTSFVPGFHGSAYVSLAIIYGSFAGFNWLAPAVVSLLNPKMTMLLGSLLYSVYIGQFAILNDYLLYISSAALGFGAAILWTAQGNFLTINSDQMTMTRNSGIFWAMMQSSMLIGNTYVYTQFKGETDISSETRTNVVSVFFVLSCIGSFVILIMRPTPWVIHDDPLNRPDTPRQALKKAWDLIWTPSMLLLCLTFFYTGLELTFWSGVYGPCIGFTLDFGDKYAKSLVGIHGIAIGIGEILGGAVFGFGGQYVAQFISRVGRSPVVTFGCILHVLAYILIFLNIPNAAPFGDTHDHAIITSNPELAIFCSLLLGLGDACFNTQIYAILGVSFPNNSVSAFAIFKFTQSAASAIAFFYSGALALYYQLLLLAIFALGGTFTFVKMELNTNQRSGILSAQEVENDEEQLLQEDSEE